MSTNMTLITSVTVGSGGAASVTLPATGTIPQTYTDLKLVYSARATVAGTQEFINISFNGNTSNYSLRSLQGDGSAASSNAWNFRWIGYAVGSTATASTFSNGELYIPNYTSSNYKSFSGDNVTENNTTNAQSILTANLWSDTAAITSIALSVQGGSNFVEGSTFYLYGISNVTSTTKATGGIVSSDGTYNYHMFPYSGTFTPTENITADYLVVAGGGGGGAGDAGGGGAGGYRTSIGGSALSLTAQAYTVTIGAGGTAGSYIGSSFTQPSNGTDSVFSTITSTGGGRGGSLIDGANLNSGGNGGSGGGQGRPGFGTAGTGNTPSTSPSQGNNGGNGTGAPNYFGGGGGGATSAGSGATAGSGASNSIGGSPVTYATGGTGNQIYSGGTAATANTGNGGNGAGNGGSGVVIIRYAI